MPKFRVALTVHVVVVANSPQHAEDVAFENRETLRKSAGADVTSVKYIRKEHE